MAGSLAGVRVIFMGRGLPVVLEAERWLELRRFRVLRDAGASFSEIARETGLNWRTVKKYLQAEALRRRRAPAAGGSAEAGHRRLCSGD